MKHKHADFIKAWADGEEIECRQQIGRLEMTEWTSVSSKIPAWDATEYRIKPKSSAEATLERLGYTNCGGELWKPPLGLSPDARVDRDMRIAIAVKAALVGLAENYSSSCARHIRENTNISDIIARVK